MARIVLLGYLVRGPIGGLAWHHLQYWVGLRRLGHEVLFVEEGGEHECYDPGADTLGADPTAGLAFLARLTRPFGLSGGWAYHDRALGVWHGWGEAAVGAFCRDAEIVLNLSGMGRLDGPWGEAPVRALVDTDPVFTQVRHLTEPARRDAALGHNAFLTFGENIGTPAGRAVPDDGLAWRPTRQPVCLDLWPWARPSAGAPFTTVMQWESYAPRVWNGTTYAMKSASFGVVEDLPARTDIPLEIALGGATDPVRERLRASGWRLRDGLETTRDPFGYRGYLRRSAGEFSVAKQGYVAAGSGWFSERSAAYLASGRPVVVQDTGWSRWLDGAGEGAVPFTDAESARSALEEVRSGYERHVRAARAVAAAFDHRRVLTALLADAREAAL